MLNRQISPLSREQSLFGRVILIVQRRWVVAHNLASAFEAEGAQVLLANSSPNSLAQLDHAYLAAAVLDGQSHQLWRQLKESEIPYVLYTGREHFYDGYSSGPVIRKPAYAEEVVTAVRRLLYPSTPKCRPASGNAG